MTSSASVRFSDLNLIDPLLKALEKEGYEFPTPIQQQAIPHVLEGRDLLGCAQTGTGKTAAFGLPILQLLSEKPRGGGKRGIRCLVLTPTRELAAQIAESFDRYGSQLGLTNAVIFGGVGQRPQENVLKRGVDILVATPGRLLDLMSQGFVDLRDLEIFVLDEADRMLDMGFIHDVRRVLKALPAKRHSLFFSATMPPDIQRLANDILSDPVKVEVTPVSSTAEKIEQALFFVETPDKRRLLEHVMEDERIRMALVFTRTKHGADKVAKFLNQAGVTAEAIHGNKSQNNRVRALNNFKEGRTRVLVATDIAARGIDIDGVTHVVNFDLPNIPESYVHRIGRTARAGAEGTALSFCATDERPYLRDIERLIRLKIRVVDGPYPGFESIGQAAPPREDRPPRGGGRQQSSRGQGRSGSPRGGERGRAPGHRPEGERATEGRAPGHRPSGNASGSANAPRAQHGSRGPSTPQGRGGGEARSSRGAQGGGRRSHGGGESRHPKPASGGRSGAPKEAAPPEKTSWWKKLLPK